MQKLTGIKFHKFNKNKMTSSAFFSRRHVKLNEHCIDEVFYTVGKKSLSEVTGQVIGLLPGKHKGFKSQYCQKTNNKTKTKPITNKTLSCPPKAQINHVLLS
jgi:hypothetical protein